MRPLSLTKIKLSAKDGHVHPFVNEKNTLPLFTKPNEKPWVDPYFSGQGEGRMNNFRHRPQPLIGFIYKSTRLRGISHLFMGNY